MLYEVITPFDKYAEVAQFYQDLIQKKTQQAAVKKAEIETWRASNAELANKLDDFFNGNLPELDFESIVNKPGLATRAASANVLSYLAEHVENMLVSSADLSNSDKTDGFLKKTHALKKGDFTGAFLQSGVAELTMAALANVITSYSIHYTKLYDNPHPYHYRSRWSCLEGHRHRQYQHYQ